MEDPLFDPWSIGEPEPDPVPAQRTPRWRSAVGARGVPSSRPVPETSTPLPTAHVSAATGQAGFLRDLVVPRLTALTQRLEIARHQTTLDDRLDQPTPSLRFRIQPWRGPFDAGHAEEGAVLEILLGGAPPTEIVGRLWLDPLSTTPSEQRRVEAAKLTDAWVDRLLLDFVEKALRQR